MGTSSFEILCGRVKGPFLAKEVISMKVNLSQSDAI